MVNNYLKSSFRNLISSKLYSFINILGLAIAMACAYFILIYIVNETSYDKCHKNSKRIFRVLKTDRGNWTSRTSFKLAPFLTNDFPEIEKACRLLPHSILLKKENEFIKETIAFVDQDIFDIFTLPLISGNKSDVLKKPHSIVISEEMAIKYFRGEEPIGKTLTIKWEDEVYNLEVTGIFENIPLNSHLNYKFFASISVALQYYKILEKKFDFSLIESWGSSVPMTYLLLSEEKSFIELEKKFPKFIEQHVDNKWLKVNYQLQHLLKIHLHSTHIKDVETRGDIKYITIFSAISILIIIVACINFIILSSARSPVRAKEIGIRKVVGANQIDITNQFLSESVLLSFIALFITMIFLIIFMPYVTNLFDIKLEMNILQSFKLIISFIIITIIVGILSGSYISFYLAKLPPIDILRNKIKVGTGKLLFRRILIVFQLIITIVLIVCTSIIYCQLNFVQDTTLSGNRSNIFVIKTNQNIRDVYKSFKNEIKNYSNIINVAGCRLVPPVGKNERLSQWNQFSYLAVDYEFFEALDLKIAKGRFFSLEYITDPEKAVLINEIAAKELLLSREEKSDSIYSLIGEEIEIYGKRKIVGIVKDFHIHSLHKEIQAVFFLIVPKKFYEILITTKVEDSENTVHYIKKVWKQFEYEKPLEYYFMDDKYSSLYKAERRLGKIVGYFSIFTILIACFGLFGLVSFITERRLKEIAIRKTLGASLLNIILLLISEFLMLTILANIIAYPISNYIIGKWLQNFAYHIDITVLHYIFAAILSVLLVFIAVIFKTLKAALSNPVRYLKYE